MFAAFSFAIYNKKKKALEILDKKWESFKIAKYSGALKKILKTRNNYFPILDNVPDNLILAELHSFLHRKRDIEKKNTVPKTVSQSSEITTIDKKLIEKIERLMKNRKYSDAIIELRKIARAMPFEPDLYLEIGDLYIKTGQNTAAFEAYEEALKRKPELNALRHNLAVKFEKNGNIKKSKLHYGLLLVYSKTKGMKDICMKKMIELGKIKKK